MPQVQLDDEIFKIAERRAAAAGYSSVDKYIADVLINDTDLDADNLDHLFTPQVVARLDEISADMHAGKSVSIEEVDKHLSRRWMSGMVEGFFGFWGLCAMDNKRSIWPIATGMMLATAVVLLVVWLAAR